jgi:LPS-assembly lipoprotein
MKRLLALACLVALSGCALRPLYAGGGSGAVAQSLRSVDIAPIDGKAGYLVHSALADRIRKPQGAVAAYRLEVELNDEITGFGVRRDDAITRERRTLKARYKLIETGKGSVVLDATAGSDVGIDAVSSEYATVAAENSALERLSETVADQIIARIALFIERPPAATP